MGLFDVFTNDVAQQAAGQQVAGINAGLTNATSALNTGYGNANSALTNYFGDAGSNLTNYFGNAGNALTSNYTAALQPFLQNLSTANTGVTGLTNLLGLNGPAGNASALSSLASTPGYQFQKDQGNSAIDAYHAATGSLASGNTLLDLSKYNQGLAGTTYQNAVSNLMPFLNQANTAASGVGNVFTGLGSGLSGIATGLGSGLANLNTGLGTGIAGNNVNQGNSLAGLNWQAATGIGNANANATLAQNQANQNQFNAAMGLGTAALGIFSDERLKENIEPVGKLYDGTGVYRYNYKGDRVPRIGVMAQEVEKSRPDAVIEVGGFKAVDYGKATDLAAGLARFLEAA